MLDEAVVGDDHGAATLYRELRQSIEQASNPTLLAPADEVI